MDPEIADLPSPYLPHPAFGLLHLPRFIGKIRLHLKDELPKSYQRNFTRGFDGFMCLHLGVDPKAVIEIVKISKDDDEITAHLKELFPADVKAHEWNRKMVQMGMSEEGAKKLAEVRADMGIADRTDLKSFADMIEFDEGRLP